MHWICEKCHKPLTVNDGTILVYNANPAIGAVGSYPLQASPDIPPWVDDAEHVLSQDLSVGTPKEMAAAQTRDALWAVKRPVNIEFGAFHTDCIPFADSTAYDIPANVTAERWMSWVHHLHEKVWMGKWDLHRMLAFYWNHRGDSPPPLR